MWILSFLNSFAYQLLNATIRKVFDGSGFDRNALDRGSSKVERAARYILLIDVIIPTAVSVLLFLLDFYSMITGYGSNKIGDHKVNPVIGLIYLAAILILKLVFSVQFFALLLSYWFYRNEKFYFSLAISVTILLFDIWGISTRIHINPALKNETTVQKIVLPENISSPTAAPVHGLLLPTAASIPSGFQLQQQHYSQTGYALSYRANDNRVLDYSEELAKNPETYASKVAAIEECSRANCWLKPNTTNQPYPHALATLDSNPQKLSSSEKSHVPQSPTAEFTYNNEPGIISYSHTKLGENVMVLVWSDNGSPLMISLFDFPAGLPQQSIINMLGTLQRVQ
jgi:hypothetical protein